jgi:phosphatidylinositol 4-kinase
MLAELVALTLPIDALVAHSNFHPDSDAGIEVTALFRNMWFICGLFRLSSDDKADMINEWQYAAMTRIAAKTPPVVLEEAQDYLTNAIEYNPIFRNDYLQIVSSVSAPGRCQTHFPLGRRSSPHDSQQIYSNAWN